MMMKFPFALILLVLLVAACSPTETPSPTPDIDAIVSATVAAREQALHQPSLLAPEDNASFNNPSEVVLTWEWIRSLKEGEHFDVRVWHEGDPGYGITWTEQTSFALADWLSQQATGE